MQSAAGDQAHDRRWDREVCPVVQMSGVRNHWEIRTRNRSRYSAASRAQFAQALRKRTSYVASFGVFVALVFITNPSPHRWWATLLCLGAFLVSTVFFVRSYRALGGAVRALRASRRGYEASQDEPDQHPDPA